MTTGIKNANADRAPPLYALSMLTANEVVLPEKDLEKLPSMALLSIMKLGFTYHNAQTFLIVKLQGEYDRKLHGHDL